MKKIKNIFVIEDSRILSEIIAIQLKRQFNCSVNIFNNGDAVSYNIKKHSPDLIVLDYNFNDPDLSYNNGLEVLVEVKKKSNIPVIVFSGQRDMDIALEIVKKGANDYISKDGDDFMEVLLSSIEDIFNIKNSKGKIKKLKNDLKKGFLFLFLASLTAISVFNFAYNI